MRAYTTFLRIRQLDKHVSTLWQLLHLDEKKKQNKEKRSEETKQFLEAYILETPGVIWLKFRMWGTDSGGHLHSKNHLVSCKQHEVTYTQRLHYCFSCQYTHSSVAHQLLGPHNTLLCVLMYCIIVVMIDT